MIQRLKFQLSHNTESFITFVPRIMGMIFSCRVCLVLMVDPVQLVQLVQEVNLAS